MGPIRLRTFIVSVVMIGLLILVVANYKEILWYASKLPFICNLQPRATVQSTVAQYGDAARKRLTAAFSRCGIEYPPKKVTLLTIKKDRQLLIFADTTDGTYKLISRYLILGLSGKLGPKLREGDGQVPEGIYQLELEPNTPYHLALRLNYPNESDLNRAKADNRKNPGSAILMHGGSGSSGCVAIGDPASEDLFILVHDTGANNVRLIIAPTDLRNNEQPTAQSTEPSWLPQLYAELKQAMTQLPTTAESSHPFYFSEFFNSPRL